MVRPEIAARVAAIAADRVHGAGFLAREALDVLALAAAESDAADAPALLAELSAVAAALTAAKPDMVPVRSWAMTLIRRLRTAAAPDAATLRQQAIGEAAALRRQSTEAAAAAAERVVALLPANAAIATASLSQTVVDALVSAHRAGKVRRVVAARSAVAGMAYGERLAAALAAAGVPVTVIPDDALQSPAALMRGLIVAGVAPDLQSPTPDPRFGLIGADAVLADGGVVNGAPSRRLAEVLAAAGKPLMVVAEAAKLDGRRRSEPAPSLAPGFDLVPPALITAIVTEKGVFAPGEMTGEMNDAMNDTR